MRRRSGITLIEVLVAIFIMAIGLLALLTLFPLAALNIARALRDDRTASAASESANICDAFGVRSDPTFDFVNPPTAGFLRANPNNPGYPVYVDPFGIDLQGNLAPLGSSAATNPPTPGIARKKPSVVPNQTANGTLMASRFFTLYDDITFNPDGLPAGGTVQRADQYTTAYMLHRPQANSGQIVSLTVVVYKGRPLLGSNQPGSTQEVTYPVFVANGQQVGGAQYDTTVTVTWNPAQQPTPALRRGSWILDSSYEKVGTGQFAYVHGEFYRVVGVTQAGNSMAIEVETPFTRSVTAVTVMDNVADVYERGISTTPSAAVPQPQP